MSASQTKFVNPPLHSDMAICIGFAQRNWHKLKALAFPGDKEERDTIGLVVKGMNQSGQKWVDFTGNEALKPVLGRLEEKGLLQPLDLLDVYTISVSALKALTQAVTTLPRAQRPNDVQAVNSKLRVLESRL
jgi:hypothetical protein